MTDHTQARAEGRAEGIREAAERLQSLIAEFRDEGASASVELLMLAMGRITIDTPTATQPAQVSVADAAKMLLDDDIALSKMAQAMHDGPLGADDHWFSDARPQGAWCLDCVRAALRAISGDRT
jgi:hypothetical protein